MNGRQMADAARAQRPGLKVLFITGYAETSALGSGQLAAGMAVLTKPFVIETLGARIARDHRGSVSRGAGFRPRWLRPHGRRSGRPFAGRPQRSAAAQCASNFRANIAAAKTIAAAAVIRLVIRIRRGSVADWALIAGTMGTKASAFWAARMRARSNAKRTCSRYFSS